MSEPGLVKAKREAAARARRLAAQLSAEDDRAKALAFAAELEGEADALASQAPPAAVGRTQIQMQLQQGPPVNDDEKSKP